MSHPLGRAAAVAVVLIGALQLSGCGSQEMSDHEMPAAEGERTAFAFTGTVERVDSTARTVMVRNDDVPGWMGAMSMVYSVDHPEVLEQLTSGARVRATVYSGDFGTLYGVELIQP